MDRNEALALLRSQHEFPGHYEFRVVVRPPDAPATVSAMLAAAPTAALVEVTERKSRMGTYVALHVVMKVPDAEIVLDVYDVLKRVDGVLTSM
jgi:putative lipoic acid-binding regulatory protein